MSEADGPYRVLAVEDDPSLSFVLKETLEYTDKAQIDATMAGSLGEAVKKLKAGDFEMVLLDLTLPDSDGVDTLNRMLTEADGLPVVVVTGHDDPDLVDEVLAAGARACLLKGRVGSQILIDTIRQNCPRPAEA